MANVLNLSGSFLKMLSTLVYKDGNVSLYTKTSDTLDQLTKLGKDDMMWVDMCNPTAIEFKALANSLGDVHHLALSDVERGLTTRSQGDIHHPKIEEFPTFLLVIAHALTIVGGSEMETQGTQHKVSSIQVSALVNEKVLLTVTAEALPHITGLLTNAKKNPTLMSRGPDYVLHLILDRLVDGYFDIAEYYERRIEKLEDVVLRDPKTRVLIKLQFFKRMLQQFKRTIVYHREFVNKLSRGEYAFVSIDETVYYRNVYDHLIRVADQADMVREMCASLIEVYFSVNSAKLNKLLGVLAVISTIFLPITFITSFYGMNFKYMYELYLPWTYPTVVAIILTIAGYLFIYFKRRGWLG